MVEHIGEFLVLMWVRITNLIFLDSSMVEHSAVNRVVVGSSPTRGAKEAKLLKKRKRADARVGHKGSSHYMGPSS